MAAGAVAGGVASSRSREGAWIEMYVERCVYYDLPCRSREGAWIEIHSVVYYYQGKLSLPRGSVD